MLIILLLGMVATFAIPYIIVKIYSKDKNKIEIEKNFCKKYTFVSKDYINTLYKKENKT